MTDHALYRFYAEDGSLLYIGITLNVASRFRDHAHGKPWWTSVHRIELEHYDDRDSVLVAETAAIRAEHPRYNVIHNTRAPRFVAPAKPRTVEEMTPVQFAHYMLERHPRVHGPWPAPEPRACWVCHQAIDGRPSSLRTAGDLHIVHAACRDQWCTTHPIDKPDTEKAFRDERREAILRGDIA